MIKTLLHENIRKLMIPGVLGNVLEGVMTPSFYIIIAAIVSIITVLCIKETYKTPLE